MLPLNLQLNMCLIFVMLRSYDERGHKREIMPFTIEDMGAGLGFGVWGLGFGVWGLEFGVWGLGFGVWDFYGLWFMVCGLLFTVCSLLCIVNY